ncbi:nucleotidyl transferase AbiEii/AbiGii toxin family protein [Patescibacteria group bacterium]|nr:nucleotidyl transferase AbiEii/AbiGii toxin family protein [Patescibacteria group bacterium]MBU1256634.1 nucleotidyl transferase AbiEii/AbiGii toxin family protein [Patescibacteria group bacterium]MBU1457138.1 nucleotidyl transferase AbiEii/AbiGii toxin family protein [Patescibacteria group bacterium]
MFKQALNPATLEALIKVGQANSLPPKTHLAGGTALALHIGHRYSFDLDFFTPSSFNPQIIENRLNKINFTREQLAPDTLLGKIDSTKFSLFLYSHPLISPSTKFHNINIASIKDIAAMKLLAIADRGTKRDFFDLYFIMQEFSLKQVFSFHDQKFNQPNNRYHLLKALTYFTDAEDNPPLKVIKPVPWPQIKTFFESLVKSQKI